MNLTHVFKVFSYACFSLTKNDNTIQFSDQYEVGYQPYVTTVFLSSCYACPEKHIFSVRKLSFDFPYLL